MDQLLDSDRRPASLLQVCSYCNFCALQPGLRRHWGQQAAPIPAALVFGMLVYGAGAASAAQ